MENDQPELPENWRDAPFLATIYSNSPRFPRWMEGFGCRSVPVTSPFRHRGTAPGHENGAEFYHIDIRRFTPDQLTRLATVLSRTFDIPTSEVLDGLMDGEKGCPILAEDVYVPIPLRFLI